MDIGLLWHSVKPVDEALPRAAARFVERLGGAPNVCYVHPTVLPDGDRMVEGVLLKSSSRVLKNHFWIGVEAQT
jgi:hypothetical protein